MAEISYQNLKYAPVSRVVFTRPSGRMEATGPTRPSEVSCVVEPDGSAYRIAKDEIKSGSRRARR